MADYPPPSDPSGGMPPGGAPPPPGGYGQPAYGQPAYGAPGGYQQPAYGGVASPKTNVLAIISLVAVLLLCGVSAVVSVPCGIIALGQIKRSNGAETGRGLAITGIILSSILTVAVVGAIVSVNIFADDAVDEINDQIEDFCEDFDTDGDGINDCDDPDSSNPTFTIPE